MKVSVIIPVYNAAPYIAATLQSLQRQTMPDFEVLLIDDHGLDYSIAIAQETIGDDSRFRFLSTPVNSGPGAARNVGIAEAKGEYVAFLDSDDLWEPDFLAEHIQLSEEYSQTFDLSYCQLKYSGGRHDGEVHRNPVLPAGSFNSDLKKSFLRKFVTFSVCFLYRREFLLSNHLYFPNQRNSEDTNFLIRCLLLAENVACVDRPLYIYNVREESLTTGHNPKRYKDRLLSLNTLMSEYQDMKKDPRYTHLKLGQYNLVMWYIWFKKGPVQAFLEIFK